MLPSNLQCFTNRANHNLSRCVYKSHLQMRFYDLLVWVLGVFFNTQISPTLKQRNKLLEKMGIIKYAVSNIFKYLHIAEFSKHTLRQMIAGDPC